MFSDNITIRIRNLGKRYTIGGSQEKYLTMRYAIVNFVKVKFVYFADGDMLYASCSHFHALCLYTGAQGRCDEMTKKNMGLCTNLFFEALV